MRSTPVSDVETGRGRVREQARDAAVLMVFSLCLSTAFAVGLLLLAGLGR